MWLYSICFLEYIYIFFNSSCGKYCAFLEIACRFVPPSLWLFFLLILLTEFLSPVASRKFLPDYQCFIVCWLLQIQFSGSCSSFRRVVAFGYHIIVHWYALRSSIWLYVKHCLLWGLIGSIVIAFTLAAPNAYDVWQLLFSVVCALVL